MCKVIDIRPGVHQANVRRVANNVLFAMGAKPQGEDLVQNISCNTLLVNNWFLVVYIINRLFPSPILTKVQYPSVIEDLVIETIVREYLSERVNVMRGYGGHMSPHID